MSHPRPFGRRPNGVVFGIGDRVQEQGCATPLLVVDLHPDERAVSVAWRDEIGAVCETVVANCDLILLRKAAA